ncbi:MAG: molybdate transport system ATP-binding protein [Phenylobacterium sp.]
MLSVEVKDKSDSPTPLDLAVDIPLDQGIVGIMGPSGCGKTTLLRLLAGLEKRYSGDIKLHDQVLWSSVSGIDYVAEKRHIGLVFQDARLFTHLSVAGNLAFALKRAQSPLFTIDQVVQWFGLSELLDGAVGTLSGGEKQRVAVARAVIHSPKLLLLDEPFVALDAANRLVLLNSLKQLYQQTRLPMIFVSHDLSDIRQLCRQLLLMREGKIYQQGETFHLLNQLETGLSLAQPVAATLSCRLAQKVAKQPLSGLWLGEQQLLVNHPLQAQGEDCLVNCLINATDVSISLSPVTDCSIANCLKTLVTKITWLDQYNAAVTLVLADQVLYAQITGYSVQRLGLQPNMTVYALFKASAVTVLAT